MSLFFGEIWTPANPLPVQPDAIVVATLYALNGTTPLASYTIPPTSAHAATFAGSTPLTPTPPDSVSPYTMWVVATIGSNTWDVWPRGTVYGFMAGGQWSDQPAPVDGLSRYLTLAEAGQIAANLIGVDAFMAATPTKQFSALAVASRRIDRARRYQGRRFDMLNQVLEFPRVAYESPRSVAVGTYGLGAVGPLVGGAVPGGDTVWDWDPIANAAVVPQDVKIATVYQADDECSGKRGAMIDKLLTGVTSARLGDMAETYDLKTVLVAGGLSLCRSAMEIMDRYVLRSGSIR